METKIIGHKLSYNKYFKNLIDNQTDSLTLELRYAFLKTLKKHIDSELNLVESEIKRFIALNLKEGKFDKEIEIFKSLNL